MLPIIDFIFILIVLVFAIIALIKGFIDSFFGLGAPIVAVLAALFFKNYLVGSVSELIKNEYAALIVTCLLIFLVVFIVLKIIQTIIKKIFDTEIFTSLNKFLGFLFGIVEGIAFVALILFGLKLQPWFDVSNILEKSIFAKFLAPVIKIPAEAITFESAFLLQRIGFNV